jgi:hypothetical protein
MILSISLSLLLLILVSTHSNPLEDATCLSSRWPRVIATNLASPLYFSARM